MAVDGYEINTPADARGIINKARGRFDDIDGIEWEIETTGEGAANAAKESSINNALQDAFTNFLRPFVVTMITAGRKSFDGTESIINIYDNADTNMTSAPQQMQNEIELMDDLPEYKTSTRTGDYTPVVTSTEGYNW